MWVLARSSACRCVQAAAVTDIKEVESGCDKEGMVGEGTTREGRGGVKILLEIPNMGGYSTF